MQRSFSCPWGGVVAIPSLGVSLVLVIATACLHVVLRLLAVGTLLVPWLFLFRRLLDLVPLWQFTAFGSSCVYQLQRLHPLETPCCSCLTDCFHFIGLIDWRAFAICALCCCLEVAIDLHHATTLLGVNTPSSSIHIIVLNLRLGLSRLKLVALRVLL